MSDSDDEDLSLPANMKPMPRATPTLVSERESRPTNRLNDAEADELRELVTKVITLRGHRKENLVPDWISAEALQIIDPHRQAPPLVREAALVLLRDLARETMRSYRPPPNALRLIEEAAAAEADDIVRRAAEEAEAHRLRCAPLTCRLCGKKATDERRSLIIGESPRVRVCERCIIETVVTALQRQRAAEASARAAKGVGGCVRPRRAGATQAEGQAMIEAIAALFEQGLSMSSIGEALGLSRGIVAGAIHRARKQGDPRLASRPPKPRAPPKPCKRKAPIVEPQLEEVEPTAGRTLLVDLAADGCRYSTGVANDGRHLFCGRPRAPGRPYCRWCSEKLSVSSASASSPRAPGPPQ